MEYDAILEKAGVKLADNYNAALGYPVSAAIDPSMIAILVELALGILKDCAEQNGWFRSKKLSGAEVKERCTNPGLFRQFFVRRLVRARLQADFGPGAWREKKGDAVVEALFAAGKDSDAADIDGLIRSPLVMGSED